MAKEVDLRSLQRRTLLPRLEFQMLWQEVLDVPRSWLVAHDTDPLAAVHVAQFHALEARRLAGEPMAYILGQREFFGRTFGVTPDVLIPRPETELLVEITLRQLAATQAPKVLDLGTGSGAIAISVALERPDAHVYASDFSKQALAVARENAQSLGARVEFLSGNWYDALVGHKGFDVIVSNPPYIAANDHHLEQGDVRFEPSSALTDGFDGLSALVAIVQGAPERLNKAGGALYMEHGWDQALAVRGLLAMAGFSGIASHQDLAGIERVTGGFFN